MTTKQEVAAPRIGRAMPCGAAPCDAPRGSARRVEAPLPSLAWRTHRHGLPVAAPGDVALARFVFDATRRRSAPRRLWRRFKSTKGQARAAATSSQPFLRCASVRAF